MKSGKCPRKGKFSGLKEIIERPHCDHQLIVLSVTFKFRLPLEFKITLNVKCPNSTLKTQLKKKLQLQQSFSSNYWGKKSGIMFLRTANYVENTCPPKTLSIIPKT